MDDIISLIPSKTVREYLKSIGHTFNDEEKATIICNVVEDKRKRKELLSKLQGIKETDVEKLKDKFVVIPHPFKRGDIVRSRTLLGVVEETQECWNRTVESFNNGTNRDWLDVSIDVELLYEGGFCESTVCTLVLEKVPEDELKKYRGKSLLQATQRMFLAEGGLDIFLDEYDNFMRQ